MSRYTVAERTDSYEVRLQEEGCPLFFVPFYLSGRNISAGEYEDDELLDQLKIWSEMHRCIRKGMDFLAMREHSVTEMSSKLSIRGFDRNIIQKSLDYLISNDYLSNRRFAESYLASRIRKKPEGKKMLYMRLKSKGLDDEDIDAAFSEVLDDDRYDDMIRAAVATAHRKYSDREKIMAFLQKSGFTYSEVRNYDRRFSEQDDSGRS